MELNELFELLKQKFQEKNSIIASQKDMVESLESEVKSAKDSLRMKEAEYMELSAKFNKITEVLKSIKPDK